MRVVVAQLGAREHYSVARLCNRAGCLEALYTDYWNRLPDRVSELIVRCGGKKIKGLLARRHPDLPSRLVRTFEFAAMVHQLKHQASRSQLATYQLHEGWGSTFAAKVAKHLDRHEFTTFFGFSSASLEAIERARELGAFTVLDEIAPTHLEDEILREERRHFPLWEPAGDGIPTGFLRRLEAEWKACDRVVVNSVWCQNALLARGVSADKIRVVPLMYEAPLKVSVPKSRDPDEPLRVLWLGTLCLRKGVHYAVEAARLLEGTRVEFTFAGPLHIDARAVNWPSNCKYHGPVARNDVEGLWRSHHVFLLPTLSDGFAITQVESIAHGLPLIVTSNCGDVVENQTTGVLIPPRDAGAIVAAVDQFLTGSIRLDEASSAAMISAQRFSPNKVWQLLGTALYR